MDTLTAHQGLEALALATGGVSVMNTNNFKEGLDRILARSSYYMLAYTPTESFDSKFHRIEVKVTRPGARVYARQGYVATADTPARATETREAAIVRAAMSPLAKREVDLAARLQFRFLPDPRAQIDINLLVNANQLTFKPGANNTYEADFDVVGFILNNLGKTQGGFSQTIHTALSEKDYQRALTTGISYTAHAELPAGTYQLRAVVRDGTSGKIGSVSQFVEVTDLAKKRLTDAPDMPTFAERGYEFYWEQMRGVVGPAGMSPEAVKWWVDTLKKVADTKKWQDGYIKRNFLTPVQWTGDEATRYLDSLNGKYEKALGDLGAIKK